MSLEDDYSCDVDECEYTDIVFAEQRRHQDSFDLAGYLQGKPMQMCSKSFTPTGQIGKKKCSFCEERLEPDDVNIHELTHVYEIQPFICKKACVKGEQYKAKTEKFIKYHVKHDHDVESPVKDKDYEVDPKALEEQKKAFALIDQQFLAAHMPYFN